MKIGILLTNIGTPDAPTKASLRRYLSEFLSDSRVVSFPIKFKFIWWLVLNVVILNTRPKKSAQNYAKIWDRIGIGSPLLSIAKLQLQGVKKILLERHENLVFEIGMRYGNPSISSVLNKLRNQDCEKIIVLPLYPQYSNTTTLSTLDVINQVLNNSWAKKPEIIFIEYYCYNDDYIQSLANTVLEHQIKYGKPNKLIISFHGIPQRYIDNGDIYYDHCVGTAKLLAKKLDLNKSDYLFSFQSIFGREPWTKPQTKERLETLACDGVEHIQVICPGFSADCLETLEEIECENRNYFIQSGGRQFSYIPALNDRNDHIEMLSNLISNYL
ncbi:ferrochelatase [Candidatus Vesicomyidisocius sp. SY067_SCS001]|uniref:ferrochelatase n=1 Tax=Candidatus Vesicomyidisocius sp. SY067_SCS001 TaxID=2732590 RepID=UPI00168228D3|nr:ferrochelatase [Candidatus Vesicomyosocius sp. SY067_SCS001]